MVSDAHAAHAAPKALQHHFDDMAQQRESNSLGMWLFLMTEIMMFGGLFFAYSLYRAMFPGAFAAGAVHLHHTLGMANTFVLLFSSLTMAMAVHSASTGNRRGIVMYLFWTLLLGLSFIGIKAVEWTIDWNEGLIPGLNWTYYDHHPDEAAKLAQAGGNPHQVLMYFVIYFSMTGLHALHMVVGIALVFWFIVLGAKGQFSGGNDQPVEILGLYWHFVDIVWVFLFPLLYLIGNLHLHMNFSALFGGGGGGH